MRKLLLPCALVFVLIGVLNGCAPPRDPVFGARDERTFPSPDLGIKNPESETYSTQILASPSATPAASVQSAPVSHVPAVVAAPANK